MNPYESPKTEPPHVATLVPPPAWKRVLVISIPFASGVLASLAAGYVYQQPLAAVAYLLITAFGLFVSWRCTR